MCGKCKCDPSSGFGGEFCRDCTDRKVHWGKICFAVTIYITSVSWPVDLCGFRHTCTAADLFAIQICTSGDSKYAYVCFHGNSVLRCLLRICCMLYVCTLLPPQKCGNLTCGSFSGCINCLFVIEEGRLVQKSTTDCLHVCSNFTVIIQSDASSGPTLQSPDTCVILIIGDSCKASVRYRVFQNDKLLTEVYIAADAGSE